MYYVEPTCQISNTINVSTDMYTILPKYSFDDNLICVNTLLKSQEDILAKVRVLQHNVNHVSKKSECTFQINDIEELDKIQQNILNKLYSASSKINEIAHSANINVDIGTSCSELEVTQNNLLERIKYLNTEINNLVVINGLEKFNVNKMVNLTILADCRKPPLSIILLLKLLRNRGYKVACMSYNKSKVESNIVKVISEYIETNLNIDMPRFSFDIIVSIIWQNIDMANIICYNDVVNDLPIFGEMVTLAYLSSILKIDVNDIITNIECINDEILYHGNVKQAISHVNNKLVNYINIDNERNLMVSSFVISCLIQGGCLDKVNKSVQAGIENILGECGSDINKLKDLAY